MIVAHGPTFAATMGRLNHVEVMQLCAGILRGLEKQIFVAHAI